jgi:hypothetical protein
MGKSPFKKATIIFCFVMALMASGWGRAEAQVPDFGLGSIVPFKSLQTFFGPLFPATCIGDTFRSEFGVAVSVPIFDKITLSGNPNNGASTIGQYNYNNITLVDNSPYTPPDPTGTAGWEPIVMAQSLDGDPVVYDFFAKFRAWRFAGKVDYSIFESRGRRVDGSGFFFNPVILSGDVDIIQGPWFTAGICMKVYICKPYFKYYNLYPNFNSAQSDPKPINMSFEAQSPWTFGGYLRYVPPEVLGIPLHFEAYADFPVKGSPLTTLGAAVVFRPQVYRFDLFTRIKAERSILTMTGDDSNYAMSWNLNLRWYLYGAEFGIYF